MQWTKTQSQKLSRVLTRCAIRATRLAFACASFWAFSLPSSSLAASSLPTNEVALLQAIYTVLHDISDGTSSPVVYPVDDNWMNIGTMMEEGLFTPIGMGGRSSLLMLLWSIYGVAPSDANLPTGEQALLPMLRKWLPMIAGNTNAWTQADIDRLTYALYDSNSDEPLADMLHAIKQRLQDSVFTNDLGEIEEYLSGMSSTLGSLDSNFTYFYSSAPQGDWASFWENLYAASSMFNPSDTEGRGNVIYDGSEPSKAVNVNLNYDSLDLLDEIIGNAVDDLLTYFQGNPWEPESGAMHEVANIASNVVAKLDEIKVDFGEFSAEFNIAALLVTNYLRKIHEVDLGYNDDDRTRSVERDFHFLHQQLGFEHPTASNSLAGVLSRFFDTSFSSDFIASNQQVVASITNSENQLASSITSASNTVANVAENEEPDFDEHRYTGSNPIDSGDRIFDLPQRQFNAITPDLPESRDSTIVLYDGNFPIFRPSSSGVRSGSLSSSPVRLNISYALRDNDDVSIGISNIRAIMEFVWDWVFLILAVMMLFSFYASLTESRNMLNSGVGGLTLN